VSNLAAESRAVDLCLPDTSGLSKYGLETWVEASIAYGKATITSWSPL